MATLGILNFFKDLCWVWLKHTIINSTPSFLKRVVWLRNFYGWIDKCRRCYASSSVIIISPTKRWKMLVSSCHLLEMVVSKSWWTMLNLMVTNLTIPQYQMASINQSSSRVFIMMIFFPLFKQFKCPSHN